MEYKHNHEIQQNYQVIRQIGSGAYGTVYKVKSKDRPNINMVMKIIQIKQMNKQAKKMAFQQVSILKSISHQNIIKFYDSMLTQQNLYIIMEEAQKGDLFSIIKNRKQRSYYFLESQIWKMIKQLLCAVNYLHSNNIIHRDIKAMNIFVMKNGKLKLGDLGVSKFLQNDYLLNTRVGTPLYLAPQLIKHQLYDFKIDIWALGCIFYYICCFELPFQGNNLIILGQNIVKLKPKKIGQKYSDLLNNLIMDMLQKNPRKRLSTQKLIKKYNLIIQKQGFSNNFLKLDKNVQFINKKSEDQQIQQSTKEQTKPHTRIQSIVIRDSNRNSLHKKEQKQEPKKNSAIFSIFEQPFPKKQENQTIKNQIDIRKYKDVELQITPNYSKNKQEQNINLFSYIKRPISAMMFSKKKYEQLNMKSMNQVSSITLQDLLKVKNRRSNASQIQKNHMYSHKLDDFQNQKQQNFQNCKQHIKINLPIDSNSNQRLVLRQNKKGVGYFRRLKLNVKINQSFGIEVKPKLLAMEFPKNIPSSSS